MGQEESRPGVTGLRCPVASQSLVAEGWSQGHQTPAFIEHLVCAGQEALSLRVHNSQLLTFRASGQKGCSANGRFPLPSWRQSLALCFRLPSLPCTAQSPVEGLGRRAHPALLGQLGPLWAQSLASKGCGWGGKFDTRSKTNYSEQEKQSERSQTQKRAWFHYTGSQNRQNQLTEGGIRAGVIFGGGGERGRGRAHGGAGKGLYLVGC